jgi:hypothetical protein
MVRGDRLLCLLIADLQSMDEALEMTWREWVAHPTPLSFYDLQSAWGGRLVPRDPSNESLFLRCVRDGDYEQALKLHPLLREGRVRELMCSSYPLSRFCSLLLLHRTLQQVPSIIVHCGKDTLLLTRFLGKSTVREKGEEQSKAVADLCQDLYDRYGEFVVECQDGPATFYLRDEGPSHQGTQ